MCKCPQAQSLSEEFNKEQGMQPASEAGGEGGKTSVR